MFVELHAFDSLPEMTAPLLHVFIALWGLLDLFFGLSFFKITVKILMAFACAAAGATIALNLQPDSAPIFIGACVVGLIIGFLLGWHVYKLGVVVLAVFAGFVLSLPFAGVFGAQYALLVQGLAGLLAGGLVFIMMEPVIMASTALTGAFRLVFGAMFFLRGWNILDYISGQKSAQELMASSDKLVMAVVLLLAAVGFFVQFRNWHGKKTEKAEE